MDYAFCLDKGFDLEFLISLENELWVCSDDPHGNKRRLLFKFSEELSYCMQVAFKINVKNARDNVKEAQKTQRRCEAMSSAIGETNQEETHTYP